MNYVKMMGGLGNQLFEYTFARYLEKKTGNKSVLWTALYGTSYETREFALDKFNVDFNSTNAEITCRAAYDEFNIPELQDVDETFFRGFFQDKKYFDEVADEVRNDLSLRQCFISDSLRAEVETIRQTESVAVHVRRGDYLTGINTDVFEELSVDYYIRALTRIIDVLRYKPRVYIFSDDYAYVSMAFGDMCECEVIPVPPGINYEDMYLMSCAKHHIIANSSFSWWSAALSKEDGITVAPKCWFKDRPDPDLIRDGWLSV